VLPLALDEDTKNASREAEFAERSGPGPERWWQNGSAVDKAKLPLIEDVRTYYLPGQVGGDADNVSIPVYTVCPEVRPT